ncbi:alpha-xenorhabdolysin family binary toxin subunit A [Pseudomonas taiwanensis]|uniref:alpha-xenorhabdolysin family binary toxin subunit A n=1 Tax=Pseudomonas taiwanensis TaxID=470150 RepID=UPI001EE35097|nr:alpha-xenorhabdolysin family binary toxin subunit A [Pseudomonas taiwanensis]
MTIAVLCPDRANVGLVYRGEIMNEQWADYELLQQKAAKYPQAVVNGLASLDGEGQGGLTLSREHILTLNRYANFVFALPSSRDNLERWLGYKQIEEPELTPESMDELFESLRTHARTWAPLSDRSKKLAAGLSSTAASINAAGEGILEESRRAVGEVKHWEKLLLSTPVKLDGPGRQSVSLLVVYMGILKEDVQWYAQQVESVRLETESFRDIARFELIPAVKQKGHAVERKQGDNQVENLREQLKVLDQDITALSTEYDQYVKLALGGLAVGPIGAAITGGIYGSKAEKVRKERKKQQEERRKVSDQLRLRVNLEGRMEELATFVGELDTRLQDVVTAASHLQTAWDTVGSYIDASIEKLESISDNKQLIRFSLYFRQFLAQWKHIQEKSLQLTQIFDDAASAQ